MRKDKGRGSSGNQRLPLVTKKDLGSSLESGQDRSGPRSDLSVPEAEFSLCTAYKRECCVVVWPPSLLAGSSVKSKAVKTLLSRNLRFSFSVLQGNISIFIQLYSKNVFSVLSGSRTDFRIS